MQQLTSGPPTRRILLFALPLLLGNVFQQLYSFTDAAVVGRLVGVEGLAAVGASASVTFLIIGFSWGVTSGLSIPVSRAFGAQDLSAMRRSVAAGAMISACVTVVITVVGLTATRGLLTVLRTPPEIFDGAVTYLSIVFAGAAAVIVYNFLASMLRAIGDSRTPLYFLVGSSLLNAVLVVAFVGGLHLGLAGAALSTVLSQIAAAVACLVFIHRRVPTLHLRREDWRAAPSAVRESLRMGLPLGFQSIAISVGAVIVQFAVNGMGATAVAAYAASQRVEQIAIMPLFSFGVAATTFVAQNRGARNWRRIRVGVWRTCLVTTAVATALGTVTIVFARPLAGMFVGAGETDVLDLAVLYFRINGFLYVMLGLKFVIRNAIQGLGNTTIPAASTFLELIARAVVALSLVPVMGFVGVAVAAPIAWAFATSLVAFRWRKERRALLALERADAVLAPAPGDTGGRAVGAPVAPPAGAAIGTPDDAVERDLVSAGV